MGEKGNDLLQGTLDMLILKAVSLGPLHGYGVLLRIQQISGERLAISAGVAVSGSVPAGAPGSDRQRVGREREQPPREVLPADAIWGARGWMRKQRSGTRMSGIIGDILGAGAMKAARTRSPG